MVIIEIYCIRKYTPPQPSHPTPTRTKLHYPALSCTKLYGSGERLRTFWR